MANQSDDVTSAMGHICSGPSFQHYSEMNLDRSGGEVLIWVGAVSRQWKAL